MEGCDMVHEFLVPIVWIALLIFTIWFLFKAETDQPLSLDDLALSWRLHKQHNNCKTDRIKQLIKVNDEVVGFKCECGYEFRQKRLVSQSLPKNAVSKLKKIGRN